jgi:hypothetical protein
MTYLIESFQTTPGAHNQFPSKKKLVLIFIELNFQMTKIIQFSITLAP